MEHPGLSIIFRNREKGAKNIEKDISEIGVPTPLPLIMRDSKSMWIAFITRYLESSAWDHQVKLTCLHNETWNIAL